MATDEVDSLIADCQNWPTTSSTIVTTAIGLECVNEAIRRMKRRHNWRYQYTAQQFTVPGGIGLRGGQIVLPPDFTQETEVYTVDPSQSDPSKALTPIAKVLGGKAGWFSAISPTANTDAIFPQVAAPSTTAVVTTDRGYYIWGQNLVIVPTPSSTITIELDYVRTLPDLIAGLTPADQNGWTLDYPDVVRFGALREVYLFLHEFEVATQYEGLFQSALKEAIDHDNARAFAGPPLSRGK